MYNVYPGFQGRRSVPLFLNMHTYILQRWRLTWQHELQRQWGDTVLSVNVYADALITPELSSWAEQGKNNSQHVRIYDHYDNTKKARGNPVNGIHLCVDNL